MSDTPEIPYHHQLKNRFRGYFPVIIDVETAGFDAKKDALLELAAITLKMDENGNLQPDQKCHFHIEPFEGANINPESLKFNGIDIHNPLRGAVSELDAITGLFQMVRRGQKDAECQRSIIVAHNAAFDQSFVMAAAERTGVKRNPFHPFGMLIQQHLPVLCLDKRFSSKHAKRQRFLLMVNKHTRRYMIPNVRQNYFAIW